jgi:prepilin-type N-terminal cleavage/methylation domain-containing protein
MFKRMPGQGEGVKKGVTFIELILVVVIIGVLASSAYIAQTQERRRFEYKGAVANIAAIAAAEKSYFLQFNTYNSSTNTATTNSLLGLVIHDSYFKNYRVALSGIFFTINMTGGNCLYTFNRDGVRTGTNGGSDCLP